jgi:signal transduction histidine kinase
MNRSLREISTRYAGALENYLASESEQALQTAYELGRETLTAGFGVLDMAQVHMQASVEALRLRPRQEGADDRAGAVENFFMEALSPFEAHHRGFQHASMQLGELSRQVLQAQEQERQRISRELHDEVGASLMAASMNLELIRRKAVNSDGGLISALDEIQVLLIQTMENTRRFSHELRPPLLDDLGLVAALRGCLRGHARRTGMKTRLMADPAAEQLPDDAKIVVYRVVQESLTNACKHAAASKVGVSLRKGADGFLLTVKDNGTGFKTEQLRNGCHPKGGTGLIGMRERLRLVRGTFAVQSTRGKGTAIRAVLPFFPAGTKRPPAS